MSAQRLVTSLFFAMLLLSCGDEKTNSPNATQGTDPTAQSTPATNTAQPKVENTKPSSGTNTTSTAVAGRSQYDPTPPQIDNLPSELAFDPCSLMSEDIANTLSFPLNQRIERLGGTRKIPGDHRYTAYIGCVWRPVEQGVPRVAVEIQLGEKDLKVEGDIVPGIGDAAWFASRSGRDELRVHAGKRVLFIKTDIRHATLSSKDVHVTLAKHLINQLNAKPNETGFMQKGGMLGGPEVAWCDVAKQTEISHLLPGPISWAIPVGAVNKTANAQTSQKDIDYVGCYLAGKSRAHVLLRYLGQHSGDYQKKAYFKQTPITIGGHQGFMSRHGILVPAGSGAYELTTRMSEFDPELMPAKLQSIMAEVLTHIASTR